ncbi:carboxymuconolactone decarboxylase family protein [Methylopila turkensis]|uniref:Decarboxylase n=1 Tax=Methylopila turkensis TaxID=1437816 RepID=A0A9W6N753_9HYPH|nr:carboxymuconolactone decarboxylase family protein [Methylopila turkensis]GLK80006.1 decarboxylase [Methylopila turkensis]
MTDEPSDAQESRQESRHARGLRMLKAIHPQVGERVVDGVAAVSPDLARCLVEFPFGDVYARPGLDLRSRQIATIAALVTLGGAERQLKWHVRGGLNVGLNRDEILEVIQQMTIYAGFPRALNALTAAQEVFEEIEAEAAEEARQDDA